MNVISTIIKVIEYRELYLPDSEKYKEATVTIKFLTETFLPVQLWGDFKQYYE